MLPPNKNPLQGVADGIGRPARRRGHLENFQHTVAHEDAIGESSAGIDGDAHAGRDSITVGAPAGERRKRTGRICRPAARRGRSGDIAYERGTFELTAKDKRGKPTTSKGKYVVVWKKQADGFWKAVADIWNADQ